MSADPAPAAASAALADPKAVVDIVLEKNGVTIRCKAYAGGPSLDAVIDAASLALKKTAPARAPRPKVPAAAAAPGTAASAVAAAGGLKRTTASKKLVPMDESIPPEEVVSTVFAAKKRAWKKEIEKDAEEGDGDWVASEDDRGSADDSDSGDSLDKAFIDNSVDDLVKAVVDGAVDSSSSEEEEEDSADSDSDADAVSVPSNPLRSPVPEGRARKAKAKGSLRTSFMAKLDAAELPPRAPKKPRMGRLELVFPEESDADSVDKEDLRKLLARPLPEAASPAYEPVAPPAFVDVTEEVQDAHMERQAAAVAAAASPAAAQSQLNLTQAPGGSPVRS